MSEPINLSPPPPSRRWRWLLLLLMLLAAAAWLYAHVADVRLARAIAEADRLDPRWRLADIEVDRAVIPDEENSAHTIIAVEAKLPNRLSAWPHEAKAFGVLTPNLALTEQQTAAVREFLESVAPALQEARKLPDQSRGRWPDGTGGPRFGILTVAKVLSCDVLLRTQEGDLAGAMASCRGMVNCGRSVGDEPSLIAVMVRIASCIMAANRAEYVLGHGETPDSALAALQRLLAEEDEAPLFTTALRGDRAATDDLLAGVQRGDMTVKQMLAARRGPGAPKTLVSKDGLLYLPGVLSNSRAIRLERMNKLVEISKLPPPKQVAPLAELTSLNDEPLLVRLAASEGQVVALVRYLKEGWEYQARVRCAVVALAAERFRREHGHWPEDLADLKGRFLGEVPLDPFDGEPLRYRKDMEGVVIYSVGADGTDRGGDRTKLDTLPNRGTDIGFRLWNIDKRPGKPLKAGELPAATPKPVP